MIAEQTFKDWYYKHGADWNAANIKPVWMAAFSAAKEACALEAEKQVTMEGYEKEIARDIRAL